MPIKFNSYQVIIILGPKPTKKSPTYHTTTKDQLDGWQTRENG